MKAQLLTHYSSVDYSPLELVDSPRPEPNAGEVLIKVADCGVCHTDLHLVEGELPYKNLPIIPGHQIVGTIHESGEKVTRWKKGDRVGVPWLYSACGQCEFCKTGRENLCDSGRFTGYHVNGGFAEFVVAKEEFVYRLPHTLSDAQAAPLLCAGVIGYRAVRLSDIRPGGRIGLFGFGASAHIAIQILQHCNCEVYVFTRSEKHRQLAKELGATWTGAASDKPPRQIESAVIFAPAGELVPAALRVLQKGGTISLAGIHMSTIPAMDYSLLYEERTVRSVANSTRQDVEGLLDLASIIGVKTEVESYPLEEANQVLQRLKRSEIRGSAVLTPS
jgi:alcohol dehydrogenase, propanol-preferring